MRLCRSACVCVCVSARKGHYFCVRACRLSDTGQRAPVDHASTPTGIPDVQQETRSWHASNCVSLDVCVCVCVCARCSWIFLSLEFWHLFAFGHIRKHPFIHSAVLFQRSIPSPCGGLGSPSFSCVIFLSCNVPLKVIFPIPFILLSENH